MGIYSGSHKSTAGRKLLDVIIGTIQESYIHEIIGPYARPQIGELRFNADMTKKPITHSIINFSDIPDDFDGWIPCRTKIDNKIGISKKLFPDAYNFLFNLQNYPGKEDILNAQGEKIGILLPVISDFIKLNSNQRDRAPFSIENSRYSVPDHTHKLSPPVSKIENKQTVKRAAYIWSTATKPRPEDGRRSAIEWPDGWVKKNKIQPWREFWGKKIVNRSIPASVAAHHGTPVNSGIPTSMQWDIPIDTSKTSGYSTEVRCNTGCNENVGGADCWPEYCLTPFRIYIGYPVQYI